MLRSRSIQLTPSRFIIGKKYCIELVGIQRVFFSHSWFPAHPSSHKPALALAPVSEDLVEGIKNTAALHFRSSCCYWDNRAHSQNHRSKMPFASCTPCTTLCCCDLSGDRRSCLSPCTGTCSLCHCRLPQAWCEGFQGINNSRAVKRISLPLPPFPGL